MTFSNVDAAAPAACCSRPNDCESASRRACLYSSWNPRGLGNPPGGYGGNPDGWRRPLDARLVQERENQALPPGASADLPEVGT